MKRIIPLILSLVLCVPAFAQTLPTTRPTTVKYVGVFAQPLVDKSGNRLLDKWYGAGCRVFLGWASVQNTAGANPTADRAAQLAWRAAVKALGPDARYVDYVLPDWRTPPTAADLKVMVDDPQCLGFFGPDEPNIKNDGRTWRVSLDQWKAYWNPIIAADPGNTKLRVADFAGDGLSAAWGSYTGDDVKPYAAFLTRTATSWHPRNKYGNTRADCDDYPRRAVVMLGNVAPNTPRWYISEIANEKIAAIGRAPLSDETWAQLGGVFSANTTGSPIECWLWFPQEPHPSAAHVFDATTSAQFETVKSVNAYLLKSATPPTTLPTNPDIAALQSQVAEQAKLIQALQAQQSIDAKVFDAFEAVLRSRPPPTTAPATQPTSRVYFETNVTPIASITGADGKLLTNPDWIGYAAGKGFTPVQFAYNGTLNRAFTWCDDAGNARPMKVTANGGDALDWARQRNASDPPTPVAVKAVARLAKNPGTYGYSGPARVLVFDLESTTTMNLPATAPTADRRLQIQRWIDAVRAAKAEGVEVSIWSGPPFWPQMPDTIDLERQLAGELASIWMEAYDHDLTVTFEQWRANVDRSAAVIATAFPDYKGRKVATVCPWWQIYWPDNDADDVKALAGTPVDLARWERQARYLVDNGWDVAIWTGGGGGVTAQLDVLAVVRGGN